MGKEGSEMIDAIRNNWRNYIFVPSGEVIRGLEIAVITGAIQVAIGLNWDKLESWRTYVIAIAAGAITAGLAYIKGKIGS